MIARVPCIAALVALSLSIAVRVHAQGVAINGTGAAADTSAILDLASTGKGMLAPRMTAAQRSAIVLPTAGLLVYQTDGSAGLYYNAGTSAAPNWQMVGANTRTGLWSTSGSSLYYSAGKVAVGTTPGSYRFAATDTGAVFRVQANNPNSVMASFGGYGSFQVDAPGTVAGRFSLLDSGYLGLGRTVPTARLDVFGGNWDVVNGEGDVRVGDGTYRLKVGVATSGGGAGGVTLMQQGVAAGYNVLALGAQGNKIAYVNGNTSRFGIGTDNPSAPLGFTATTGKKITLYPGGYGDYGFRIGDYALQLASENSLNAYTDVALGTDSSGTFNEKFAFKANGEMAVMGNAGAAGQVLQSGGTGAQSAWGSPTSSLYARCYQVASQATLTLPVSDASASPVPGLSQSFTVPGAARVMVSFSVHITSVYCLACGASTPFLDLVLDGVEMNFWEPHIDNAMPCDVSDTMMFQVGPGAHTVSVMVSNAQGTGYFGGGPSILVGTGGGSIWNTLTVRVIPE